jgi:hypothetical protein
MTEHIIRILKEELEDYIKATYETPFEIDILGVEWKDDTDILEVCYDVENCCDCDNCCCEDSTCERNEDE